MTDSTAHDPSRPAPPADIHVVKPPTMDPHVKIRFWLVAGMLALAMIGMGVAQSPDEKAWSVWLLIILAYGIISFWYGRQNAARRGERFFPTAWRQVLHWASLLVTLKVLFLLQWIGFITLPGLGNIALLLLTQTCFLAGVHFDWMFFIVALFLALISYASAYASENVWMIVLPAAAVVGLVMFGIYWWYYRRVRR